MGPVLPHPQGAVLLVKALPGARKCGLAGLHSGALKVAVTAAPEKGKANAAIAAQLCQRLGLRTSQITLLAGETARQKRFLVAGLSASQLGQRLDAALDKDS